jgi:hypothetical protein
MKVFDVCCCRLGNAIFRYMASSLFCIIYGANRTYNENDCKTIMTEDFFRHWSNKILNSNIIIKLNPNMNFKFNGFYQTDIYKLYRDKLLEWFINNQNDSVNCDDNPSIQYRIGDLIQEINLEKKYDVVVHIRLEDYVTYDGKLIIHPQSICKVLDEMPDISFCFVCNKINTEFEKKYIDYFKNKYNIILEQNDLITDFKIMSNAKVLICSNSTLCWTAGFLSKTVQKVYFPKNKFSGWPYQTFSTIIYNTVYYDNILCDEKELTLFFNNQ